MSGHRSLESIFTSALVLRPRCPIMRRGKSPCGATYTGVCLWWWGEWWPRWSFVVGAGTLATATAAKAGPARIVAGRLSYRIRLTPGRTHQREPQVRQAGLYAARVAGLGIRHAPDGPATHLLCCSHIPFDIIFTPITMIFRSQALLITFPFLLFHTLTRSFLFPQISPLNPNLRKFY